MTPTELRQIGIMLYGSRHGWQTWLAKRIGVSDRTMRRWVRGDAQIPRREKRRIEMIKQAELVMKEQDCLWVKMQHSEQYDLVYCDGYPVAIIDRENCDSIELLMPSIR